MPANSPKSGPGSTNPADIASEAARAAGASTRSGTRRSTEELEADISKLREDIAQLTRHLKETGEHSVRGARRAAEDLRAQGEATMEGLREKSNDMQAQIETKVREKPITALAMAAAVGYVLAILTRR